MDFANKITTMNNPDPLSRIQEDKRGIQNIPVDEKTGCSICEWRYGCAGGCPLLTKRITGQYEARSPYCDVYSALFPEVVRLEGLRLMKYSDDFRKGMSKC